MLHVFILIFLALGCGRSLTSFPNSDSRNLPVLPEINSDRDHDMIPDGVDHDAQKADIPQWSVQRITGEWCELGTVKKNFALTSSRLGLGVDRALLLAWLQNPQLHPGDLLPTELKPTIALDFAQQAEAWAGLLSAAQKRDCRLKLNVEWTMEGAAQDQSVLEEMRWRIHAAAGENQQSAAMIQNMYIASPSGHQRAINSTLAIPENHAWPPLRHLSGQLSKVTLFRRHQRLDLNEYWQQLRRHNITVLMLTPNGDTFHSFAPGMNVKAIFQKIDQTMEWDEEQQHVRKMFGLQQQVADWQLRDSWDSQRDQLGRWDVILPAGTEQEAALRAGTTVLLIYSTVAEHRALTASKISQALISHSGPVRLGPVSANKVQLFMLEDAGMKVPRYQEVVNRSLPALVERRGSDGEGRSRIGRYVERGWCGINMQEWLRDDEVALLSSPEALIRLRLGDDFLEEKQWYMVGRWLLLEPSRSGELVMEWGVRGHRDPATLGLRSYGDCAMRSNGENFRWAPGIDVGPWPNPHRPRLWLQWHRPSGDN